MKQALQGMALGFMGVAVIIGAVILLQNQDDTLDHLREEGLIRIGYAVEAPYAFLALDGEVMGEAPEIARQIVRRLKIRHIEWRQSEFANLITELEAGRIDIIAAGLFITPEREKRVLFSEPTLYVRPGLLVAQGNPQHLLSYHQLAERKEVRIATLSGAVEEQTLQDLGVPATRLVRVPDALTGRRAVESEIVDALVLSELTVRWMAREDQLGHTEMIIASDQTNLLHGYGRPAFAFRLSDKALQTAWNAELRDYLNSDEHLTLLARLGLTAFAAKPQAYRR